MSDRDDASDSLQHVAARVNRLADLLDKAWAALSVLADRVDDLRCRVESLERAAGLRD